MPFVLEIDPTEIEDLAFRVEADARTMEAAAKAAANGAVRWARTQVARGLSSRLGIPSAALKGRLRARTAQRGGKATLWIGLNPINVVRAKPKETPGGLRVGRQDYPGAFLAHMPNGKRLAMRRRGRRRLPLESVLLDVNAAAAGLVDRETWPELNARFIALYQAELEKRVR